MLTLSLLFKVQMIFCPCSFCYYQWLQFADIIVSDDSAKIGLTYMGFIV